MKKFAKEQIVSLTVEDSAAKKTSLGILINWAAHVYYGFTAVQKNSVSRCYCFSMQMQQLLNSKYTIFTYVITLAR